MPRHATHTPPQHTITVKGLTDEQVHMVKAFVQEFTRPVGMAVDIDRADKDVVRRLLYCNYASLHDAENAEDGLSQLLLQKLPVISEFHQVRRVVCPLVVLSCVLLTLHLGR